MFVERGPVHTRSTCRLPSNLTPKAITSQAKPVDDIMQRVGLTLLKILKGDVYENPATREFAHSVMIEVGIQLGKLAQ